MNPSLPVTLVIPGSDACTLRQITSTKYRFQGRMRLADGNLHVECSGTAMIEEVGMLGLEVSRHRWRGHGIP